MTPDDKVVYLDRGQQWDKNAADPMFAKLRTLALERLLALFRHMLDQVDDALFERADKADSSNSQAAFFAAMRQIRLSRRELETSMKAELSAMFSAFWSDQKLILPTPAEAFSDEQDLALVDNDLLERSIALDSMISKTRSRNALAFERLNDCLDQICRHRRVDESNSPFDPRQLTNAFARCAERVDLEIAPRLIFYKLFERHVLDQLPGLLEEIDSVLAGAGVRPTVKPRAPKSSGSQSAAARQRADTLADGASESEDSLMELLRGLLATRKQDGAAPQWTGTGYSGGVAAATVGDVVSALSQLQRTLDDTGSGFDLKDSLGAALEGSGGARTRIARAEDDTIDIVEMLFEAILAQPSLPVVLKAQIARLQIPVVKVALLDRSLFARKSHPARRLINELAHAAVGWIEPEQPGRDPLYRQIERVVERVLEEFDDDVSLFSELLDEFLQFRDEERERARLMEERTRQAAEGKARVDNAKDRVARELAARTRGRRLPGVVESLLDEAWSKVLFITLLKEGDESAVWHRQLDVVDRLLWSIEPKAGAGQRKELLVAIPALLSDLREGLNGILFNPLEMTRLFKALEAEHIRCLSSAGEESPEAPQVTERPSEPEETEPAAVVEPAQESAESAVEARVLDEWRERVGEVAIGTWFEFERGRGTPVRGKLSARLRGGERLIFVNRSGFKCADKTLDALAQELEDGVAAVLDDDLLFDRALETVVANLRDLRAGQ